MHRLLPKAALALLLCLIAPPAALADDGAEELARLQATQQELANELGRAQQSLEQVRAQLRIQERELNRGDVTAAMLEQTRLEVASQRARTTALRARARARREALRQVDDDLLALQAERDNAGTDAQSDLKTETQQLESQAAALQGILNNLDAMAQIAKLRTNVLRQRLALLQSRFELPDLDARPRPPTAQSREAQQQINAYLREATRLRTAAATASEGTLDDVSAKRLLELQSAEQETLAEYLQIQRKAQRATRILRTLDTFTRAESTPLRVLNDGAMNVREIQRELESTHNQLALDDEILRDQRAIIAQQGRIVEGPGSTFEQRLAIIDSLLVRSDELKAQLQATQSTANTVAERYVATIGSTRRRELLDRSPLPEGRFGWQSLGAGLLALPGDILRAVGAAIQRLGARLITGGPGQGLLLLVGLAVAIAAAVAARRLANHIAISTLGAARLVFANLAALTPAIVGLLYAVWATGLVNLQPSDARLLCLLVAFWPIGLAVWRSAAALASFFDDQTTAAETARFNALLRRVLMIGGVLAAFLALAQAVSLSPAVSDAANRLSMLCLILLAIPALQLRSLVLHKTDADGRRVRRLSLALPILMLGIAGLGLWGYTRLAWALIGGLLLLIGIGITWAACRALLLQGESELIERVHSQSPDTGEFWSRNIIGPIARLSQLGLLIGAILLFGLLLGWSRETPVIRSIPAWLDTTLFSVGTSPIKLSSLVASIVIVWLVFWAGGWSKQVSYRVVSKRVDDVGIRNSLSTFTQYAVVVFGLMVALKTIGLDLTALTVFAGALGVGIGFGLQTIVTNFISGILLLVERPLAVKDIVNVDKYEGEVTQIGIRSLTVKTWDAQEVIIPNSAVITKPFTNWTRSDDVMRTVLKIQISYEDDPHQAVAICKQALADHEAVLDTPAPAVRLWDFTERGLLIWIQFHSQIKGPVPRAELRSQVLFALWDSLKAAGIHIPYPKQDIRLSNADPDMLTSAD